MDTKAKRAAALGYGLSFLLVLPPAAGAISIEMAGHALSAYEFDLAAVAPAHSPEFITAHDVRLRSASADDVTLVTPSASSVTLDREPDL